MIPVFYICGFVEDTKTYEPYYAPRMKQYLYNMHNITRKNCFL